MEGVQVYMFPMELEGEPFKSFYPVRTWDQTQVLEPACKPT